VTESSQRREIYIGSRQAFQTLTTRSLKKFALVLETGRILSNMNGCPRV